MLFVATLGVALPVSARWRVAAVRCSPWSGPLGVQTFRYRVDHGADESHGKVGLTVRRAFRATCVRTGGGCGPVAARTPGFAAVGIVPRRYGALVVGGAPGRLSVAWKFACLSCT